MRRFTKVGSGARARGLRALLVATLLGAGMAAVAMAPSAGAGQPAEPEVTMAPGALHTCSLDAGEVRCWGNNSSGELGYGNTEMLADEPGELPGDLPPVDLGTGRTATAVSAGDSHTCALLDDGSVKCWGSGDYGALGYGDTSNRGDEPGEMGDALPAVDLGTGKTATAIMARGPRTCVLLDGGDVKCWGYNAEGQAGYGDVEDRGDEPGEMGDALPLVDLGAGRTATALAMSPGFNCVLLDSGDITCWGIGYDGQLGDGAQVIRGDEPGEMGDDLPLVDLGTGRTAVTVTVGANHTCVLLDSGEVACWGNGLYGQLANGTTAVNRGDEPGELGDALPLVDLGTGRTATTLEARGLDVCALLDDGHVKCWGYNGYGQLGQGNTENLGDDPAEVGDGLPVVDLGTGRTATAVYMGESHECARLDDGSVKCWGLGAWAQLGLGDREWRGDGPDEMGDALASLSFEPSTAVSTCAGQEVTVDLGQEQPPTAGADVILGTPGEDVIRGLGGDDVICGLGGTDTIGGGGGKDRIFGGGGDDSLRAGPGGGLLAGNAGADTLRGDKGNDTLRGGADDDVITGGAGNDVADGGAGDNTCDLAPGRDRALSCG